MSFPTALETSRQTGGCTTSTLRLLWSPRSPFSRKVVVVAHERGLSNSILLVHTLTASTLLNAELMALNPLNRIPTLVLEDGRCFWDSRVICEFLDTLGGHPPLLPVGQLTRLECLRWQALGDGMMELNVARLIEAARDPSLRSSRHMDAYRSKIQASVELIEEEGQAMLNEPLHLGHVSIACALSHLDFRFESDRWRERAPVLAAWYESFSQRPSMMATAFREDRLAV